MTGRILPLVLAFIVTLLFIGAFIYFIAPRLRGGVGVQTTTGMAQPGNTGNSAQAAPAAAPAAPAAQPGAVVSATIPPAPPAATSTPVAISITAVPPIEVATAVAPTRPPVNPVPNDIPNDGVTIPDTVYSSAPCNSRVTHIVRAGENLFRIALQYRTTAAAVARMNNITNVRTVSVGRRLQIVVCGRGYSSTRTVRGATYTVQPGDTIFRIALRYGVNTQYLCRVNGLYSNLIVPGQTLIIP